MPEISVIIPVRNGAATIADAIESVLMQTCRDLNIVVVDDGSTDATMEIVKRLAEKDRRIVPCTNPSPGLARARNFGPAQSDSEYIAVMDADDICMPDRFAAQLEKMQSDPSLVLVGSRIVWFGDKIGTPHMLISKRECREGLKLLSPICHPTALIRRKAFYQCGRYNEIRTTTEDYELFCRLSFVGEMENIRQPLLKYRVHKPQITQSKINAQRAEMWKTLREYHCRLLDVSEISDRRLFARLIKTAIMLGPLNARQSIRALKSCWQAKKLGDSV